MPLCVLAFYFYLLFICLYRNNLLGNAYTNDMLFSAATAYLSLIYEKSN